MGQAHTCLQIRVYSAIDNSLQNPSEKTLNRHILEGSMTTVTVKMTFF